MKQWELLKELVNWNHRIDSATGDVVWWQKETERMESTRNGAVLRVTTIYDDSDGRHDVAVEWADLMSAKSCSWHRQGYTGDPLDKIPEKFFKIQQYRRGLLEE